MDLSELIKNNPEINITIKAKELEAFGIMIAQDVAKELLNKQKEKLYTRTEVMQEFKVCSATLWRWDKLGLINSKKVGHRRYYHENEILKLIGEKK